MSKKACNCDLCKNRRKNKSNVIVYSAAISHKCTSFPPDNKDCRCDPEKPKAPCNTTDCECLAKEQEYYSRLRHKAFCPSYKHKVSCPVTKMHDEETEAADEEESVAQLPYGLPPLKFGPCQVPGKLCSASEGIPRKGPPPPPQVPPPPAPTGKICVSKEFERIKACIDEFNAEQNKMDFLCIHKHNVDTEARCCDKAQTLFPLIGKSCCAEHKLAQYDAFNAKSEVDASEKRNTNLS